VVGNTYLIIYLLAATGLTSLRFTSTHRCIHGWMIRQVSMDLVVELLVVVHLYSLVTEFRYVGMGFHHDQGVSASIPALLQGVCVPCGACCGGVMTWSYAVYRYGCSRLMP